MAVPIMVMRISACLEQGLDSPEVLFFDHRGEGKTSFGVGQVGLSGEEHFDSLGLALACRIAKDFRPKFMQFAATVHAAEQRVQPFAIVVIDCYAQCSVAVFVNLGRIRACIHQCPDGRQFSF